MIMEHVDGNGKVDALLLRVKVVPGSSRDQIAGKLGDRLKIKVAAAPENGLANQAVIRVVAELLGIPPRNVSVFSGQTHPEKSLRIVGTSLTAAHAAIASVDRKTKK